MTHLSILFYYKEFSVTLNDTKYKLEGKKIEAKMDQLKNNFLQPINSTWFIELQRDLFITGLKGLAAFRSASLVIKDGITEKPTIHPSTNWDAVYEHPLNLVVFFLFPHNLRAMVSKINSGIYDMVVFVGIVHNIDLKDSINQ